MARIGIWIPCEGRHVARSVAKELRHSFEEVHVIRLRDRTGPSVGERLAALESALGESVCVGCGKSRTEHADDAVGSDCAFPTVAEHMEHLTREHAALVVRVSDLEGPRLAVEPIAHVPEWGGDMMPSAIEFAPVRPEPGSVAEDPDRLAKAAEPTDDELFAKAQAIWNVTGGLDKSLRAIARALYDLGRECGGREWEAMRTDRAALLARAEKAEWELAKWVQEACDVGEALAPYRVAPTAAFLSRAGDIRDLVGDWQKRGEGIAARKADLATFAARMEKQAAEIAALRDRRAEDMRRGFTIAVSSIGIYGTLHMAEQAIDAAIAELPKAAAVPDGETRDQPNKATSDMITAEIDAEIDNLYAERAKARAASVPWDNARLRSLQEEVARRVLSRNDGETRDPLTDPREGDWFVDGDDGCVTEITGSDDSGISLRRLCPFGSVTTVRGAYRVRWFDLCAEHRTRPMTPAEVEAFKRDGTRPSAPTPIVHVPVESAGANGARLSEAEMAAELYENGWYRSSAGWARRGSESDGYTYSTNHAHAAMRAAKGAK